LLEKIFKKKNIFFPPKKTFISQKIFFLINREIFGKLIIRETDYSGIREIDYSGNRLLGKLSSFRKLKFGKLKFGKLKFGKSIFRILKFGKLSFGKSNLGFWYVILHTSNQCFDMKSTSDGKINDTYMNSVFFQVSHILCLILIIFFQVIRKSSKVDRI